MANNGGKNLSSPMPVKASFTFGQSGQRSQDATRIIKGNGKDLRSRPGNNNGR